MHAFRFGPKAIQDINRFQAVLARYPRAERLSIVRFLSQSVSLPLGVSTITGGGTMARGAWTAGTGNKATRRKLSKVASSRVRTANGTFAPVRKATRTKVRSRSSARAAA